MANNFVAGLREKLKASGIGRHYHKYKYSKLIPKYTAGEAEGRSNPQRSIVFLCPSTNVPKGGVKVIYNQAALINAMPGQLVAKILHPLEPEFSCTWFKHAAEIKRDLNFNPQTDFVIIPEFWAVPHARLLRELGVRYGIYVQGGYLISRNEGEELEQAYRNAEVILAISDDTAECVSMAFPECVDRIRRVHYSVDASKFNPGSAKEAVICYMPRKMQQHSQLATFFLKKHLPPHWRIEKIEGLDEDGVAAALGNSTIFLSFNEMEGCPLPPIEAALSGCFVIGYTGQGGKEYWDNEMFTEIHAGDIKGVVRATMKKIEEIDSAGLTINHGAIQDLAGRYSPQVELADMKAVAKIALDILERPLAARRT